MNRQARRDFEYLSPPGVSFWRWTDNGRVLVWNDATTIAFREEIEHVLSRLSAGGLPPFGAAVLLLAACRPGWRESGRPGIEEHARKLDEAGKLRGGFTPAWFHEVLDGLDRVAGLRLELRTGTDAKAAIAGIVFDASRMRGSPGEAEEVLRLLAERPNPPPPPMADSLRWDSFRFLQDLAALRDGLGRIGDEAVETRLRTGLDALPGPVRDIPGVPAEDVRTLLADLKGDPELSGLARLASNLMAAVHLPRRVSDPEELPLGGASDISNRGPIERLLVSELAHDELTLAARVALHEALFLRREQPPRNLPGGRWILLDSGIRMWGLPRVFGAAVALALAATAERGQEVRVWRASARGTAAVDLRTRCGLLEHLAVLEPSPVPVAGLARFLEDAAAAPVPVDLVVVTSEEAFADAEFAAALAWLGGRTLRVATVDAVGRHNMHIASRRGRRLATGAVLSLDALSASAEEPRTVRRGIPLGGGTPDAALPVFLGLEPCPFLLPHEVEPSRAASHPAHGTVAATRDGRLMHWSGGGTAARQLTTGFPRGVVHWISVEDEGTAYALVGSSRAQMQLVTADLAARSCTVLRLAATGYPPVSVFRRGDAVVLGYPRKLDVFDLHAGELHAVVSLDRPATWGPGRYFRDRDGWACVAFDGASAVIERVPLADPVVRAIAVWDRTGIDGPWMAAADGRIIDLSSGRTASFPGVPPGAALRGISRDGHLAAFLPQGGSAILTVHLDTGTVREADSGLERALQPEITRLPVFGIRRRFVAVGHADGRLVLVPRTGPCRAVELDGVPGTLSLRATRTGPVGRLPFFRTPGPRGCRFGLKVAAWNDGSRAWLDARGLLHLRSADRAIPEVALVLADAIPLAGWTSSGHLCGPSCFVADPTVGDATPVFAAVSRFVERLP